MFVIAVLVAYAIGSLQVNQMGYTQLNTPQVQKYHTILKMLDNPDFQFMAVKGGSTQTMMKVTIQLIIQ